ncbi:alpha-ketoacid dehydrogenase subunit beta [Alicyclobacillus cycloheptanicus]|uniref:Pyruvate dehydrogenase E1 component beta subunit n=1 Tax=Alicyclobacillus cycloheptanicus TaxID=1457 RepID=A0ABT9XHD6_9BACL|nr:alpha-ketoacid dehydrogenase subunit beta [Alicyclobacillus cycloheptanicus]MDQ0189711.1 pyruvate dehydrogenase E1 component beta subunit [Alicyclobacillus cycloheptanicus]WDM01923.1 alpha-ketoacid dehydrogenase subunit beta [Alicyclobacillus cycloheptanicus]
MAQLTLVQAVNEALREAMRRDERVMLLGEDIGANGGVFRATEGLMAEFGEDRVVDTPLAESGILGTAVGLAVNGMRPVPEIQFMGFIYPGFEQVVSHIARIRMRSRGRFAVPMVVRVPFGGRIRAPELHSESTETFFAHTPGLTVVAPSNPYDAKGLLLASIESNDPVIFLEPMRIYRAFREEVPEGYYTVPLREARVVQEGTDLTVIAWGTMLRETLDVVRKLEAEQGLSAEVIDLRTLSPWDEETVFASVNKTGRAVVVHEAVGHLGLGAEIAARISEACILQLEAPVVRISSFDVPPPPFSLEDWHAPTPERIASGIAEALSF